MSGFDSISELIKKAESAGSIAKAVLEDEANRSDCPEEKIFDRMAKDLDMMKASVESGLDPLKNRRSLFFGGDACKLAQAVKEGKTLGGTIFDTILTRAVAVSETNACMGRIVAAPTAGSCGIIPAVLITLAQERKINDRSLVMSLFTCAGIGMVIAQRASISGAQGGCQAECGSAAAMAAAGAAELAGGTPRMAANACAFALKSTLGLVCDPVAGLVAVPCIKRNAAGAAVALAAADMALSGIETAIPPDEVIDAMKAVGESMPQSLKETAQGGLAATPAGKKLARKLSAPS